MSTPFFLALRDLFPGAEVTAACSGYVSELYQGNGTTDRLIILNGALYRRILKIRSLAPDSGWDISFTLPPSFSSALTLLMAGAGERFGYATDMRSIILTGSIDGRMYKEGHLSDAYAKLAFHAAGKRAGKKYMPSVTPPAGWREIVQKFEIPGRYAVLCAGAKYGSAKMWPGERYSQLAQSLASREGLAIVKIGTPAEREYLDSIAVVPGRAFNIAGECGTRELIAVLKGAEVVIGNDSGPVHISAALGTPTVSIFGSTSPEWTAPKGIHSTILRSSIECTPCFRKECPLYDRAKCFDDIIVKDVVNAVSQVLKGKRDDG